MRALWAAGLLLRRLRPELAMVVLLCLIVAATSFVFAAAPRLLNRVYDDALRYAAQVARPSDRNVALVLDSSIVPGQAGGIAGVRAYGDDLVGNVPASLTALTSDRADRFTSVRLYFPRPLTYETHISLRYQDGFTEATRLTAGRWPVDRGEPLRIVAPGTDVGAGPVVVEVALSVDEAAEIGVGVGDRVVVTLDGSDPLVRGRGRGILVPTEIEVTGLYLPVEPDAAYWTDDTELLQVTQHGEPDAPIAYATAYVAAEAYPSLWASGLPFHFEWRLHVDPQRLDADQVSQLQVDVRRLGFITGVAGPDSPESVTILTGLARILERYAAERALSESVLSIAAIGPFGLAGGAVAIVAILLVRQRRPALTLARGRGASGALLLGTQLWEAIVFAGGAALVGLLGATMLIDARASPLSSILALAVGGLAIAILVGASWPLARRPLGQLDREDAAVVLRVPPRRLVIEATIVAIAAGATLLLRQRGLAVAAPGDLAQADPLLASVPVLGGLAAGIVTVRLYPLPIRALGWLAARRRDFVPVLGLRTIGRHPAAANLPLLMLMLTAAFGAFASVVASSVDRGQIAASYLKVGADFRVEAAGLGALVPAADPATIPGVEAVATGYVDTSAAFASTPKQRASIYLRVVATDAFERVAAGTAAEPRWPAEFGPSPAGADVGTEANPIPAILSAALPYGSPGLGTGATFRMTVNGYPMTFRLVEQRSTFAGVRDGTPFAIVPLDWVQASIGAQALAPTVLWVRAPAEAAAGVAADFPAARGVVHIVSRHDAYALLHDAPLGAAIGTGYGVALVLAAIYMALTIVGALILSAARRTRDLAYLRTLGVTARQALALTILEQATPVLLAIAPGIALGIGLAILCEPGLGLATFVGSSGVPLVVDWGAIGLIIAALSGVVAAAVMVGTWLSRRARLADALRVGED